MNLEGWSREANEALLCSDLGPKKTESTKKTENGAPHLPDPGSRKARAHASANLVTAFERSARARRNCEINLSRK